MNRTDPPPLKPPDSGSARHAPELPLLCALDVALVATSVALAARHTDLNVACWAPNASDQVRTAAAIIAATHAMRQLLFEYDSDAHTRIADSIPF
jgi:hypothetical protein